MICTSGVSAIEGALNLTAEGYNVFPCAPRSKDPLKGSHGFEDATTNPATIRRRFGCAQNYNLAVRTGMASRIWVLDIDPRHGGDKSLAELERAHGALPPTRTVKTGDGWHLWWRTDCPVPSSHPKRPIAPGIDAKGDPGYVLVPPSIHPSGRTYEWLSSDPPATAPNWLVRLTRKPPPPPIEVPYRKFTGSPGAYGAAALDREIEELSNVAHGGRNNALNLACFRLYQLVAGGELDDARSSEGSLLPPSPTA
jgi:hypothetical protein